MKHSPRHALAWSVLVVAAGVASHAAEPATSPEKADEDFKFQGEYEGTIERDGDRFQQGVQVVALGRGKFDAVGFHGGLPGAGWDGSDKVTGSGERRGSEVVITN